jgi:hypothetical protein
MYDSDLVSRFLAKVAVGDANGCNIWTASKNPRGYGYFKTHGRNTYAHRFAWQLEHGGISDGLKIPHVCDNPACVKVSHTRLGTNAENSADMVAKGRQARGTKNGNAVLTEEGVRAIKADYRPRVFGLRKLAKKYGVYYTAIYKVLLGESWSHVV